MIRSRCRYGGLPTATPAIRTALGTQNEQPSHNATSTDLPLESAVPAPRPNVAKPWSGPPHPGCDAACPPRRRCGCCRDRLRLLLGRAGRWSRLSGAAVFPAFPLAPLALLVVYSFLGVYGAKSSRAPWPTRRRLAGDPLPGRRRVRLVASLLTPLGSTEQLGLWVGFIVLDSGCRTIISPLPRAPQPRERWVLVGDEEDAERLRAYAPLKKYANVVGTVPPAERGPRHRRPRRRPRGGRALPRRPRRHLQPARRRRGAAGTGPRLQVDRRPVSLLPRPLDLLEAQSATPNRVGGVPLIEVEALAARGRHPLHGARPPRQPQDQGQRRRPGDERGAEHRPGPRTARGPARGDPRRRQLQGQHGRGRPPGLSRASASPPRAAAARATPSAPASPP